MPFAWMSSHYVGLQETPDAYSSKVLAYGQSRHLCRDCVCDARMEG